MPVYTTTIKVLSFLIGAMVVATVFNQIKALWRKTPADWITRKGDQFASELLISQIFVVDVVGALYYLDKPQWEDFGYKSDWPFAWAFAFGILSYFLFVITYGLAIGWLGLTERMFVAEFLTLRPMLPRSRSKWTVLLLVLVLNPFTEELVFRGFLVYYLGHLTESLVIFSIIGLLACLAVHSYQHPILLAFHTCFYLVSLGLLFSPLGLAACFGNHLAGDLYPFAQLKAQYKTWKSSPLLRSMRRERRLALAEIDNCSGQN